MKKLKAFTLIEILVAMLVGSFVILMATELISYQGKSRSQHNDKQQMLAFEIALKTLRGDINAAMKSADGRKNVVWSSDNNSSVTLKLNKLVYSKGLQNLETVTILWVFSDNSVTRSINDDPIPLNIEFKPMTHRLEILQDDVFYLKSQSKDLKFASVIDLR
jgi:prepilin-type N-terminal cleavage/methylation domain-containing protein